MAWPCWRKLSDLGAFDWSRLVGVSDREHCRILTASIIHPPTHLPLSLLRITWVCYSLLFSLSLLHLTPLSLLLRLSLPPQNHMGLLFSSFFTLSLSFSPLSPSFSVSLSLLRITWVCYSLLFSPSLSPSPSLSLSSESQRSVNLVFFQTHSRSLLLSLSLLIDSISIQSVLLV